MSKYKLQNAREIAAKIAERLVEAFWYRRNWRR